MSLSECGDVVNLVFSLNGELEVTFLINWLTLASRAGMFAVPLWQVQLLPDSLISCCD